MQLNFDATKIEPNQGTPKHPTGKFPAIISETKIDGKSEREYHLIVVFTTPAGQIRKQYNLATESTEPNMLQMVNIARSNLSALCHATGIYQLQTENALLNARCMIEVTPQAKNDKYNEVSKVYDANGNEPGKAPANVAAANGGNGGWPTPPQAPPQPAAAPAAQGWSNPTPAQNNAPAPNPAPANTGWQQGPSAPAGQMPDWARNK